MSTVHARIISVNPDTPHGDDLDPATAALAALAAAHRSLSAVIDREIRAACGLSLAEADVLATLARGPDGRQRMVDLASQMVVSNSGVTQIINQLVAAGLAAREPCATDRRLVYAAITTAGRDLIGKGGPLPARGGAAGPPHEPLCAPRGGRKPPHAQALADGPRPGPPRDRQGPPAAVGDGHPPHPPTVPPAPRHLQPPGAPHHHPPGHS